jgi:hypothetical protein
MVVLAMVIGFPIAVVCSWAFEMTPEGIKLERDVDHRVTRKTGRKLMALITVVAALAAGVTAFRFLHSERGNLERQPSLAAEIEANCFDCNERLRSRRWKKMSTTAAASFSISPSRQRGRGEGACLAAI